MTHNHEEEGIFDSLLHYILYLSPFWIVVVLLYEQKGTNDDDDEHKGPSWKSLQFNSIQFYSIQFYYSHSIKYLHYI